jgi:tetratricopeptide (TPR) repeat protein
MERLEILNAQPLYLKTLRIERQADSFQVQDLGGVLPSAFTYTDWKSKMMLPTSISKIQCWETKSYDSKLTQESKYIHAGLKTTIKYAIDELKQKSVTAESVNNIKHMLGINAQSLEASRERLEDEVKIRIRENNEQESYEVKKRFREEQRAHEMDEAELIEEVLHFTQELLRNRKQLENETDLDAIWIAKELIREILMTLGLLHIELSNISSQSKYMQNAIQFFTEELKMIKELELLLTQDGDDRVTRRRLCTMRGWAHGNLGTAHLNLALSLSTDGKAQERHFQDSVDQMVLVHHSANAVRAWCDRDQAATAPFRAHQETLIHRICAFELESFANRWRGVALWKVGNLKEAAKALDAASACFFHPSGDLNNRVHEAYLSLLVQRCSAALQFADLAVTEADKCLVAYSTRKGVDRKQKKDEGIKLITVAMRAYRRGMLILQEMNHVGRKNTMKMVEGSNLPTENQIRERIIELEERNSQLKATNDANLKNLMDEIHLRPHGNDVPCSMRVAHHEEPPTKLIAVKPRLRHRKNLQTVNTATSLPNDFVGPGSDTRAPEETTSPALKPTQYCKWGDDLLPKSPDGGVLYEYPGCCPPLPSELQT